jgi:pyocin large subunit-like protein
MNSRTLLRFGFLLLLAGAAWFSRSSPAAPVPPRVPEASAPPAPEVPAEAIRSAIGFRDRSHLTEHFEKHGAEFGRISIEDYLRAAQTLRDRPAGGEVLESVRSDGVVTRFDRASGAFLAFDRDGVIRTYFRPNDGEAYYQRQLKRGHSTS